MSYNYSSPSPNQPRFNQGNLFASPNSKPPAGYRGPGAPQRNPRPQAGGPAMGVRYALFYVGIIWLVHILNTFVFGGALNYFGIHPLDVSSIWTIFTSPLLHGGFDHLISNTVPGAVFSFFIGSTGRRTWWEVTLISIVIGGIGTWFLGGVGTNHVGASGVIYGWLSYLVWRGLFNRSFKQAALGIVLGFLYAGFIWGVLPNDAGVSWQGHFFGGVGGVVAGMLITSDDPPRPRRQKRLPGNASAPF